jgi:transposase
MAKKIYKKASFPEGALEELLNLEKIVTKPRELKKIQAILFALRDKMTAKEIANLICIHTRTVKEYWARYRKEGKSFILEEKRGSGKGKKYLTSSEEEEFLKPFLDKAKVAGILTVSVIHKALEEKLGHKVHDSMVYKMLHRHNWRKIVPRKYHPKADKEKQKEFKKDFKSSLDKFKKNSQR